MISTRRSSSWFAIRALLGAVVLVVSTVGFSWANASGPATVTVSSQPVATGLDFPAAFTFAPDGRIFYGERFTGDIRIFDPATQSDTLFFAIPNVVTAGEQGLLGVELHPAYPAVPVVYAYATRNVSGTENQIVAIRDTGGTGSTMRVIFRAGAAFIHNGGRILFGPDGKLFAVIGENGNPANSQNLGSKVGKVLRMTASGAIPPDNPFPGSYVYAFGIRNSYGFGFDPQTGWMWEAENGPECNDELNLVLAGQNYAWGPNETCSTPPPPPLNTNQDGANPILPESFYTPTIAPTGTVFCQACGLGSAHNGRLFFGANNTGDIRSVTLDAQRDDVVSQTVALSHPQGILSMERGPDRSLYFSDETGIFKLVP